jgi:hypothetical protein
VARKKQVMNSPAEQQAILDKPVNPTGVGEDQAIKDLLSDKFVGMNDMDAAQIAIAVAKIVRGVLKEELDGTMGAMQNKIAEMEKTAQLANDNIMKYAQDMYNLAEKNRVTDREKVPGLEVKGAELMAKAREEARAAAIIRKAEIDDMVKRAPTIKLMHSGHEKTVRVGGVKQTIVEPHIIRFEHLTYKLPPNEMVDIPDFIAKAYMEEQEKAKERNKLREVLKDGKNHYGKAIQADPVVDPNYSQRISESVDSKGGIIMPQGG